MKSFLEGRPVVARDGLPAERSASQLPSFATAPAAVATASAPPSKMHGEKKIETVEVDGVIQKIVITCGCGEQIEVHCGY